MHVQCMGEWMYGCTYNGMDWRLSGAYSIFFSDNFTSVKFKKGYLNVHIKRHQLSNFQIFVANITTLFCTFRYHAYRIEIFKLLPIHVSLFGVLVIIREWPFDFYGGLWIFLKKGRTPQTRKKNSQDSAWPKKRQDADFGRKFLGYRKLKSQAALSREKKIQDTNLPKIKRQDGKNIHSPSPPQKKKSNGRSLRQKLKERESTIC